MSNALQKSRLVALIVFVKVLLCLQYHVHTSPTFSAAQLLLTPPSVVLLPFPQSLCLSQALFIIHSICYSPEKGHQEDVNLDGCSEVILASHIPVFLGSLFFLWLVCCIIYTFHKRGGEPSGFGVQPKLVRLSTELR